jgi:hypothetical protein
MPEFSKEALAVTEAGEVMTLLGEQLNEPDELALVHALFTAHNRAALTVISVHAPGFVGQIAARLVRSIPPQSGDASELQAPSALASKS